ncbi:hypothetical protein [Acinetobacter sp.]|uniref:hypothetical protein n=1 Tax=Acinetobacter sp. TaxID=472 RepID=UPI00388EE532
MKINNKAEYDAAKIKLSGADESLIYYAELKAEMLEYRRANNIFEVGDWVVIPSRGNGIFQVSRLLCRSDVQEMIHATDAEIKAKRRLDLPQVSSIIKANFKNAAGEDIQVIGKVRELKGRTICCDELGTGKPFFCLPNEFEKYDLPKSVILSLGEVS